MTNPVRSVLAVMGGLVALRLMDAVLPSLVTHVVASALAGYAIGRIAGHQEVRHAAAGAAILTAAYLSAVLSDNPDLPPMWMRVTLLVATPPALIGGAWLRARARALNESNASNRPHVSNEENS